MAAATTTSFDDMRKQIDAALAAHAKAAPAMMAAAAAPASLQGDFCTLWPAAKPILQAIAAIIAFIPGIGAGAGPILNSLITIGDQIHGSTCKATP